MLNKSTSEMRCGFLVIEELKSRTLFPGVVDLLPQHGSLEISLTLPWGGAAQPVCCGETGYYKYNLQSRQLALFLLCITTIYGHPADTQQTPRLPPTLTGSYGPLQLMRSRYQKAGSPAEQPSDAQPGQDQLNQKTTQHSIWAERSFVYIFLQ